MQYNYYNIKIDNNVFTQVECLKVTHPINTGQLSPIDAKERLLNYIVMTISLKCMFTIKMYNPYRVCIRKIVF